MSVTTPDPFGLVGQVLDGQYRVDALVRDAKDSVVYRGHNLGLNEPVCVKALRVPTTEADAFVRRFREDARQYCRISQTNLNLVRGITSNTTTSRANGAVVPYLVLEWLEGTMLAVDLEGRRAKNSLGRVFEEARALLAGAADGLAHAHRNGATHRDLNPSNVYLVQGLGAKKTKLLDFAARKVSPPGGGPTFVPGYGAPEQFDPNAVLTAQTDVYAFALLFTHVLTDRQPVEAASVSDYAKAAIDRSRRPTPRSLGYSVSDEIEAVFTKALQVTPTERQRDLGDFWSELARALGAERGRSGKNAAATMALGSVNAPVAMASPGIAGLGSGIPRPSSPPAPIRPMSSAGHAAVPPAPPPVLNPRPDRPEDSDVEMPTRVSQAPIPVVPQLPQFPMANPNVPLALSSVKDHEIESLPSGASLDDDSDNELTAMTRTGEDEDDDEGPPSSEMPTRVSSSLLAMPAADLLQTPQNGTPVDSAAQLTHRRPQSQNPTSVVPMPGAFVAPIPAAGAPAHGLYTAPMPAAGSPPPAAGAPAPGPVAKSGTLPPPPPAGSPAAAAAAASAAKFGRTMMGGTGLPEIPRPRSEGGISVPRMGVVPSSGNMPVSQLPTSHGLPSSQLPHAAPAQPAGPSSQESDGDSEPMSQDLATQVGRTPSAAKIQLGPPIASMQKPPPAAGAPPPSQQTAIVTNATAGPVAQGLSLSPHLAARVDARPGDAPPGRGSGHMPTQAGLAPPPNQPHMQGPPSGSNPAMQAPSIMDAQRANMTLPLGTAGVPSPYGHGPGTTPPGYGFQQGQPHVAFPPPPFGQPGQPTVPPNAQFQAPPNFGSGDPRFPFPVSAAGDEQLEGERPKKVMMAAAGAFAGVVVIACGVALYAHFGRPDTPPRALPTAGPTITAVPVDTAPGPDTTGPEVPTGTPPVPTDTPVPTATTAEPVPTTTAEPVNTAIAATSSGNTSGNTSSGNTSSGTVNTSSGNTSSGNTSSGNTSGGNTSSGTVRVMPTAKPTATTPPVSNEPGPFNPAQARASLASASGGLAGCKKGGPTGAAFASVVFVPDGTVSAVTVDAPFTGTSEGACISGTFRRARVPAFTGSQQVVRYHFRLD